MPCKAGEGKLSHLWTLKQQLACLEQRRLETFRFLLESPSPEPNHWLSKTPEDYSQLLFSQLTLILAKTANEPRDSYLSNEAAFCSLLEFLHCCRLNRPGAWEMIEALAVSGPLHLLPMSAAHQTFLPQEVLRRSHWASSVGRNLRLGQTRGADGH